MQWFEHEYRAVVTCSCENVRWHSHELFMSLMRCALLIAALSLLSMHLSGQTKPSNAPNSPSSSQRDIAELKSQIAALEKKVEDLQSTLNLYSVFVQNKQDRRDPIVLDFTDTSYQRLDTDNGFLLVSAVQATPYLNGYKIVLKIGNPLSMTFSGFKAKIKWSKAYDFKQYTQASYAEWEKSVSEKEVSLTNVLEGGAWNTVELVIAPATPDQLEYVTLSVQTNTVRLYQK
jgi:hypothetical protein